MWASNSRSRWRRALLSLVLVHFLASSQPAVAATYAGRPVRAILTELQSQGLTLIYNDQLVRPGLTVQAEPVARSGIPLLEEILGPLGLAVRNVGPGTWAIVAAPARTAAAAPGPAVAAGLDEVVVTASQYNLSQQSPEAGTFLTQEELRSLPKLADEALRAVHRLPGAASNGLSGLAHIRGGEENETRILLDGMELQQPFHLKSFFAPISVLDATVVDTLDVYAGGFPVDYGGRMSSIVDARSITPAEDGEYAIGLSLFHLNGLAGGGFAGGRGHWLVSARRSNLDQVIDVANSNLGEPRYVDTFGKAGFALSDTTDIAIHGLFAEDHVKANDSPETEFAKTNDRNTYLWATLAHRWNDRSTGRLLASYTNVNNARTGTLDDPGNSTGSVDDHRKFRTLGLKAELEHGTETVMWRAGIDVAAVTGTYDYDSTLETAADYPFPGDAATSTVRDAHLHPDGSATGAFLAARWRVTGALTGEVGLRWDNQTYDGVDGGTQLSPRVNLLYDLSDQTQLRASWGRFYQPQEINELQVEDGVDNFYPAQRADHFIVSLEHDFADGLSARLEAYYKDYDELRPHFENLFDPLVVIPELQADRVEVAATAGSVQGLELLLTDRSNGPWGWWLSYAWSRAEETVGGTDVARSWDQRNSLNGGIRWNSGPWDVALAGTWHTGWPTTPVTLAPDAVIGDRNSIHFDTFRSVDARASYTFGLGSGELMTFVEVTNLLGLKNDCCVEYTVVDPGGDAERLQREVDYWPRFVPNLGVLWKF